MMGFLTKGKIGNQIYITPHIFAKLNVVNDTVTHPLAIKKVLPKKTERRVRWV